MVKTEAWMAGSFGIFQTTPKNKSFGMIIHPAEQNSADWMIARSGILTASEADNILTPQFKARDGKLVETYLCAKLAERWLGGPLIGFTSFDAEQGSIVEQEARPWLSLELGQEVQQVGLCLTDDSRVGASPDGIVDGVGVEIKSPQPTNAVRWLLAGELPPEFRVQVHFGMYVTGFKEWIFLSYRRKFPKLVLRIARDEKIQDSIKAAVEPFLTDLDAAYARLIDLNGGPPKRHSFGRQAEAPFVSEMPS